MRSLLVFLISILAVACSKQAPSAISSELKKSGHIIGGTATQPSDFARSATVGLYIDDRRGLELLCSGTLISSNLVVSAAHCLDSVHSQIYISFSEKIPKSSADPLMIKVSETVAHPDYKLVQKMGDDQTLHWTTEKDISLLKLAVAAPDEFKAVAIHANTDLIPVNSKLLLAGFGTTSDEANEPAVSLNQVEVTLNSRIEDYLVIDQSNNKGACFGDSGGPAYVQTTQGWVVVGATHAARPGYTDCHHLGDYTSLSKYMSFIVSVALQLGAEAPTFVLPSLTP